MIRTAVAALTLLGVSVVSQPASAQPYMWGVGPKLGMVILPGRYPYAFPTKVTQYDFITDELDPQSGNPDALNPNRDLDADLEPRFSTLTGVGFDLRVGGEGFYGIDAYNRIGAGVGLAGGTRYLDYWLTLNYDRVLWSDAPLDLVAGAQIGYGGSHWNGDATVDPGGINEQLKMSYYPIRARLELQYRDKVRMYGLGLFVQDSVPARTTYTDLDGKVQPEVGGPGNWALFFAGGLEIDVQFGDFTPPKKKKPPPKPGTKAPAPKTGGKTGGTGTGTGGGRRN